MSYLFTQFVKLSQKRNAMECLVISGSGKPSFKNEKELSKRQLLFYGKSLDRYSRPSNKLPKPPRMLPSSFLL